MISTIESLESTVVAKNPYLYRGYRYDTENGLHYLQSRYDPDWGRFINADAITGSTGELLTSNMFAYCRNKHHPNGTKTPTGRVYPDHYQLNLIT